MTSRAENDDAAAAAADPRDLRTSQFAVMDDCVDNKRRLASVDGLEILTI